MNDFYSSTVLQPGSELPLYRQVHQRFIRAIRQGILLPGQRVPSVRALASELQISRNTVEVAYDLLIGEGYLEARGQAGTVVSPNLNLERLQKQPEAGSASEAPPRPANHSVYDAATHEKPLPYQLGLPALDLFPHKLWAGLNTRQLRLQSKMLTYPAPAGFQPLREAIAGYLHLSRGVDCSPQQVFITAGYRGAMTLLGRTLLRPMDEVWLEDPCFPPTRHLMAEMGAQLVPVPVDEEGMRVEEGKARALHARFALVTPAHQSPLGVSLSLKRRMELLAWAESHNAFVIEDDYDSEYRYDGQPLPSLSSLGASDNVLYVGTFSKVLSPALRLAYLVVPKRLVPRFNESCHTLNDGCPLLSQGVVVDFIKEGHFTRHLRKMRTAYAERRQMVIDSLLNEFGQRMNFSAPACGLHLLARLGSEEDDQLLAQRARERQFGVAALSARSMENDCGKGLLLGFANVATPEQAASLARGLRLSMEAAH
ncbi:PLP-dependent aminotransferase family protein [Chromobacterium alticapitis]|uniref:Putative 8-amino-7-oxononanoate synthase n=1 Tax=Chromobacterium alticapitis TaxID=2073169 RepID=A0A2S5DJC5_9NEIS|nr:PLP-dependent aminotransferase family protein [Chromobacterium alticapitis]POZ63215.1 PLP-dependent aminotransferase family protein [Chromobacterium alticapitis]